MLDRLFILALPIQDGGKIDVGLSTLRIDLQSLSKLRHCFVEFSLLAQCHTEVDMSGVVFGVDLDRLPEVINGQFEVALSQESHTQAVVCSRILGMCREHDLIFCGCIRGIPLVEQDFRKLRTLIRQPGNCWSTVRQWPAATSNAPQDFARYAKRSCKYQSSGRTASACS